MHHRSLRELAKFASGLVAADLATTLWFAYSGLLPVTTMGITMTETMVWPAIVFDAAALAFLVHYGWRIGDIPSLRERSYLLLAGLVFAAVAIVHFARILFDIDVNVMGYEAPHWISWTASIAAAYLSYMSLHLAARLKRG
jgi:hypothetical protein